MIISCPSINGLFGVSQARLPAQYLRYAEKMIKGKTVAIKSYGTDRYNRQLAEVFVGNTNPGFEMIKAGLAEVYNRKRLPKGFNVRQYLGTGAK